MLKDSPQTIRFKDLRYEHVKQMFESGSNQNGSSDFQN